MKESPSESALGKNQTGFSQAFRKKKSPKTANSVMGMAWLATLP